MPTRNIQTFYDMVMERQYHDDAGIVGNDATTATTNTINYTTNRGTTNTATYDYNTVTYDGWNANTNGIFYRRAYPNLDDILVDWGIDDPIPNPAKEKRAVKKAVEEKLPDFSDDEFDKMLLTLPGDGA